MKIYRKALPLTAFFILRSQKHCKPPCTAASTPTITLSPIPFFRDENLKGFFLRYSRLRKQLIYKNICKPGEKKLKVGKLQRTGFS
jgi:hypothetical protein